MDVLNKSEDFANIDDLLGGNDDDDDNDQEKTQAIVSGEPEVDTEDLEEEDGFDNDCLDHGLKISVPHLKLIEEENDMSPTEDKKDKRNIFSSSLLNNILREENVSLKGAAQVAESLALEGISEVNKDVSDRIMKQFEEIDALEGIRAGLGQKKKTEK